MRLIDADAFLLESIKERRFFIYKEDALNNVFVVNTVYDDLKKALDNAPTIDAVEVVRCWDCKFSSPAYIKPEIFKRCSLFCKTVNADFFCAYGAKMDAEVTDGNLS